MRAKGKDEALAALSVAVTGLGVGFTTGREVMVFFSRYGLWSWAGCILAALLFAICSYRMAITAQVWNAYDLGTLYTRALGGSIGRAAAWLNGVLMVLVGGMLMASIGELTALALPVNNAYEIGIVIALFFGACTAGLGFSAVVVICGFFLPVFCILYALMARLPAAESVSYVPANGWQALPLALVYAALHASFSAGTACGLGREWSKRGIRRIFAMAGGWVLALLLVANAVLGRHTASLRDAALPIVMLSRPLGAAGYWLCLAVLYLASLASLSAVLQSLAHMLEGALPGKRSRLPAWFLAWLLPFGTAVFGFANIAQPLLSILYAASALCFLVIVLKPIKVCSYFSHNSVVTSNMTFTNRGVLNVTENRGSTNSP